MAPQVGFEPTISQPRPPSRTHSVLIASELRTESVRAASAQFAPKQGQLRDSLEPGAGRVTGDPHSAGLQAARASCTSLPSGCRVPDLVRPVPRPDSFCRRPRRRSAPADTARGAGATGAHLRRERARLPQVRRAHEAARAGHRPGEHRPPPGGAGRGDRSAAPLGKPRPAVLGEPRPSPALTGRIGLV